MEREGDGYVSLCPELDVASQGDTIEEARKNLQETADPAEIDQRKHSEVLVTNVSLLFSPPTTSH